MLSSSPFPSTNLTIKLPRRSSSFIIRAANTTTPRRSAANTTTPRRSMAATAPSLYDVLGLQTGANSTEIKFAYRKLALSCHPDVCKTSSSTDEFMRIHSAYSMLSDPVKRADYDRGLELERPWSVRMNYSRSKSFSGRSCRSWETDQCW